MISSNFIKSSIVYSIVGALPYACGFILLPFYTNLLTTEQFGLLALYIALTGIFQVISGFAMEQYIAVQYIENKDNPKILRQNVATIVGLQIIAGIVLTVIMFATGNYLLTEFSSISGGKTLLEFYPWGLMCVATAICNSMFKTYTVLLIFQQRPVRFFWVNIFNFILTLGVSLSVLYYLPYTLNGPMYGRLISGVGILALSLLLFIREFGFDINFKLAKGILNFCYPMLLGFILIWAVGNIDRYILAYFLDAKDVGIFDFAIKCTLLLELLQSGLMSAITPKVFNIWKEQKISGSTVEVNRYFNGYTAVIIIILPLFVIAIPLLIKLVVVNTDFYTTFKFLGILAAGFAFSGIKSYFNAPLLYFKKTQAILRVNIYTLLAQLIITIILIKHEGIWGAVWAFFIVRFLQVIFLWIESRRVFNYNVNKMKLIFLPLFYIIQIVITVRFIPEEYSTVSALTQLITISCVVILVYRNEMITLLKQYSSTRR